MLKIASSTYLGQIWHYHLLEQPVASLSLCYLQLWKAFYPGRRNYQPQWQCWSFPIWLQSTSEWRSILHLYMISMVGFEESLKLLGIFHVFHDSLLCYQYGMFPRKGLSHGYLEIEICRNRRRIIRLLTNRLQDLKTLDHSKWASMTQK